MLLSKACVPDNKCRPFLACPVGAEHVAIASEEGVTLLGWQVEETDEAVSSSLMEVAMTPFSNVVNLYYNAHLQLLLCKILDGFEFIG